MTWFDDQLVTANNVLVAITEEVRQILRQSVLLNPWVE